MRILILGATGRTGKLILKTTIDQGYQINCLVREPKNVSENNGSIKIFKGSPNKIADLKEAIKDCDGIISALNISRKNDFPWSKLQTPKTFLSSVMENILSIAKKNDTDRIVICSAWGVSETKNDVPFWFKWLIDYSNIGVVYKDHERQEKLLKSSGLKWTIVRPAGLTNSKKEKEIIESYNNRPKPNMTISRKAVAKFMVNAFSNEKLIKKTPVISTSTAKKYFGQHHL